MHNYIKSVAITTVIALVPTLGFAHDAPVEAKGAPAPIEISGSLKLDHRQYWGDTEKTAQPVNPAGTYQSGTYIRDLGLNFDGDINDDYSYTISLNFDAKGKHVGVDDAWVTYYGFRDLAPNFTVSVGQVIPGFCVSCAASSKWIPFMERSMGTNVFGPQQGMGVSANTFDNNYSVTAAATSQPKMGSTVKDPSGNVIKKHDLWQGAIRTTYAPIAEEARVLQLGISGHIQELSNIGVQFNPAPETRSGNSTSLINTTTVLNTSSTNNSILIAARNQKTIDLELSGMNGPWSGEVEYQRAYIARGLTTSGKRQGKNLHFYGYHAQASYVLTGEHRPHKKSNGTFGQIKPHSKKGAWEVSARYSVINLNNQDISGGRAKNTAASISWYANNNVRVIGEYVISKQKRQFTTYVDKRHVNSLGARLQVVF
jgi:phosphate-selective porin OprO/OprP